MAQLTFEALCDEAETTPDRLARLIQIGVIRPAEDGTFTTGDIQRSRTVASLEAAGITLEQIAIAVRDRWLDFTGLDRFYPPPARRSDRSYAAFRASMGEAGERLDAVYAAFGLAEPEPERRMRSDDEAALTAFIAAWDLRTGLDPELASGLGSDADVMARAARLSGEGMRRFAEGWVSLFTEALSAPVSARDPTVDELIPIIVPRASRVYEAAEIVAPWLLRRHLEVALDALNAGSSEEGLAARGVVAPRPEAPPAIAFIDLSGFTRLTQERGDALAVRSATRLAELAARSARRHDGRLVKMLGDGVMLRFDQPADAVRAALEVIAGVRAEGLPEAHAGIASGPLMARDGDYFGHTVNLAARLSSRATGGRILVDETTLEIVGDGTGITFTPAGTQDLKGVAAPVATWWAERDGDS